MQNFRKHFTKIAGFFLILVAVAILNMTLAIALLVLLALSGITVFLLIRFRLFSRQTALLLFAVTLVYLGATLAIHYANFYPFGGGEGDQRFYHRAAVSISEDFRQGNFSLSSIEKHLEDETVTHYYPVAIGALYVLTVPDELVGKMVNVWLAGIISLLVYLLALEIGAAKKWAFWSALAVGIYPSLLYWGSMLLRESMVGALVLFCLLQTIKMIKQFTWQRFVFFYVALAIMMNLRFYIGLVVLFVFIFSWVLLLSMSWKKKLLYGVIVIPLLGFLPLAAGTQHGYYGLHDVAYFLNKQRIVEYRVVSGVYQSEGSIVSAEDARSPLPYPETAPAPFEKLLDKSLFAPQIPKQAEPGLLLVPGSLFTKETLSQNPVTFAKNLVRSFVYVALGPFPWDIHYVRQIFVLGETIPWLIAFFFIMKALIRLRFQWRVMLPIIFVALGIFAEIALLINAYGISMRIRIPAFLLLLALLPLAFPEKETAEVKIT
ncbi:MAG: hypothetical protein Q7R55_00460 [Candidatus Wildermuthbacteria bacterium]|nr:hypothetical protein [Candidatus Wildermuthbacteria bacterium]